jgi:hypothetical protein
MASLITRLPRRAIAVGIVGAVVAAAAVALLVDGCGGSSVSTAAVPTRTAPLETIFEAQPQLFANPGPTLDLLKRIGVDDVKVFMPWGYMAPNGLTRVVPLHFDATSPAAYSPVVWEGYDAIVRAAKARGIGVDLALEGPAPLWATAPGVPRGTASSFLGGWKPSAAAFASFVTAVARRYSGHYTVPGQTSPLPRVDFWSIWNEPNYGQQLSPQAIDDSTVEVSPVYYRALLNAAWGALQATGHGHDKILIGEIAPRGQTVGDTPGNFSGMVPLRFIRALYCVDQNLHPLRGNAAALRDCPTTAAASKSFAADNPALFHATGFAFHPYPQGFAPNVRTPQEPDYADLPQLPELESTLDGAIAAYGSSTHFPLYDTEFGYQTNPPETGIARAISPSTAAIYANWAEYISWRDPRVVSWDQYLLTDPPPGTSNFDTGLEFYTGQPKALYQAFRMPVFLPVTSAARGHALEVWGCVRPAHFLIAGSGTPQIAQIQFKATKPAVFKTVKRVMLTDPYGYFDVRATFASSGFVRIAWSYPHGRQLHSRTVQITIR